MSDTARDRLEAEAAELYPDEGFVARQRRRSHVRAKTVSAEQLKAAARVMHNMTVDTLWGESASEVQADLEVQRAAFLAAGFLIEGDSHE